MSRFAIACLIVACAARISHAQNSKPAVPVDGQLRGVTEPALAKELIRRTAVDQAARFDFIDFTAKNKLLGQLDLKKLDPKLAEGYKSKLAKMQEVDRNNLRWMKEVVGKHGWPGKSMVGAKAAQDAWLLVQHADSDRDFQESCLKKMEALPKGEVDAKNIAYLTDRVLVGRGKKQKYGTQAMFKDGKAVAQPIDDAEHVDERRMAIGLQPLAEYLKMVEKMYSTPRDGGPKKPK